MASTRSQANSARAVQSNMPRQTNPCCPFLTSFTTLVAGTLFDYSDWLADQRLGQDLAKYIDSYAVEQFQKAPGTTKTALMRERPLLCAATRSLIESAIKLWSANENSDGPLPTCEWLLTLATHGYMAKTLRSEVDLGKVYDHHYFNPEFDGAELNMGIVWSALQTKPLAEMASTSEDWMAKSFAWLTCVAEAKKVYAEQNGLSLKAAANLTQDPSTIDRSQMIQEAKNAHSIIVGLRRACDDLRNVDRMPQIIKDLSDIHLLHLMINDDADREKEAEEYFSSACLTSLREALGREPDMQDIQRLTRDELSEGGDLSVKEMLTPSLMAFCHAMTYPDAREAI